MNWHFEWAGRKLSLVERVKVWFWLRRCERLIKREMAGKWYYHGGW